ncbi:MAG TPA: protein-disulfide reductase DsbD domain-containing protein, partial [Tepidisphaeraceae bacterium]|nr:protein-disulfide reductase DsbD domain-containing protein [Tepidisphaeraceae bacterium]
MKHLSFVCRPGFVLGILLSLGAAAQQPSQMPWPVDQSRATIRAALNYTALQPGQQAVIAVVLDVAPGFHAQSHTPLDPNLIAFEVKLEPNDQIQAWSPVYPPGQVHEYPALGKVSVYDGRTITYIPIELRADARPGKLTLNGTATYQICDDEACYPPEDAAFSIQTEIVPPG